MSLLETVKSWPMPEPDERACVGGVSQDIWTSNSIRTAREAVAAEADRRIAELQKKLEDPHRKYWVAIAKAAEAIGASPNCGPEQAAEFCRAIDRLSAALMSEEDT